MMKNGADPIYRQMSVCLQPRSSESCAVLKLGLPPGAAHNERVRNKCMALRLLLMCGQHAP